MFFLGWGKRPRKKVTSTLLGILILNHNKSIIMELNHLIQYYSARCSDYI